MVNLISEARKRGYKEGTPIRYVPHAVDYVEGDYFEEHDQEVAYELQQLKLKLPL